MKTKREFFAKVLGAVLFLATLAVAAEAGTLRTGVYDSDRAGWKAWYVRPVYENGQLTHLQVGAADGGCLSDFLQDVPCQAGVCRMAVLPIGQLNLEPLSDQSFRVSSTDRSQQLEMRLASESTPALCTSHWRCGWGYSQWGGGRVWYGEGNTAFSASWRAFQECSKSHALCDFFARCYPH